MAKLPTTTRMSVTGIEASTKDDEGGRTITVTGEEEGGGIRHCIFTFRAAEVETLRAALGSK